LTNVLHGHQRKFFDIKIYTPGVGVILLHFCLRKFFRF